ncbi:DUF6234 family protein [Nocardiopsis gilva]|nr:DUF6234 family protein [Nocardiopsis gilva]
MTTNSPSVPTTTRSRPSWGADLLVAVLMFLLEAGAVVVIGYIALIAGLGEALNGAAGGSGSEGLTRQDSALIALGVLGLLAAGAAVLFFRGRWRIAGVTQVLVAMALVVVVVGGAVATHRPESPAPGHGDEYTGPGGQCRSGGDSEECQGSGG